MQAPSLGQLDRWRSDAPPDEARFRELVDFVELRARSPDEVAMRQACLDLLQPAVDEKVIDVGCGSGVVTRDIARRLGSGGHVLGVDPNAYLLREAARLAREEGLADRIDWREGDARRLDFADASFDLVVCVTVLAHIPDSEPVVAELVRLLRPGGRIGILEIDPESMLINHPDRELTRRVLSAANDYGFANAWVSRRVPGLLQAAGVSCQVRAFTSLERDPGGFLARAAELRPRIALQAGAISREEADRWLELLQAEMRAGRYLAGMSYVFAWGRRGNPSEPRR